ncbi:hypothetical protein LZC95_33520 [Pendulispora brunnea]|uniref:Thiaminase-2/PQQC domain-containing protein n=1 Tax=Pendulispora brunnea TaxID=2905690 RepID=A0ABZ2JXY3_9BACT
MKRTALELLRNVERQLEPKSDENRLVPAIAAGKAPRSVLAALACEQHRIITSDWRSFLFLAARSPHPSAGGFFTTLAQGEVLALDALTGFAEACGVTGRALEDYAPRAGCQAYPAYLAWLALNADPSDVVLAVVANFSAWGNYCRTVSTALREHYGFGDADRAFFDFFAAPAPDLERQALQVIQSAIDAGRSTAPALEYGRLLQRYELMFWNTLAEPS